MYWLASGLRERVFSVIAPRIVARRGRWRALGLPGALLAVQSGCVPPPPAGAALQPVAVAQYAPAPYPAPYQLPYPRVGAPPPGGWRLRCVQVARDLSGLALYSEAGDWWDEAAGRYARAPVPSVGAVLALQRIPRLPGGHIGVVSAVLDSRSILMITVDWVEGELGIDQEVVDVSPYNDWTLVRVWYPPSGSLGATVYPSYGFIVPPAPRDHDGLVRQATQMVGQGAQRY